MGQFSHGMSDDRKIGKNFSEICKTLNYNHLKGKNESVEVIHYLSQLLYVLEL